MEQTLRCCRCFCLGMHEHLQSVISKFQTSSGFYVWFLFCWAFSRKLAQAFHPQAVSPWYDADLADLRSCMRTSSLPCWTQSCCSLFEGLSASGVCLQLPWCLEGLWTCQWHMFLVQVKAPSWLLLPWDTASWWLCVFSTSSCAQRWHVMGSVHIHVQTWVMHPIQISAAGVLDVHLLDCWKPVEHTWLNLCVDICLHMYSIV